MSFHSDALSWFRANWYLLFILNAACIAEKEKKYQFYSLWFDPFEARTHNQPHSRLACKPLNHRWGFESAMPLTKLTYITRYLIFLFCSDGLLKDRCVVVFGDTGYLLSDRDLTRVQMLIGTNATMYMRIGNQIIRQNVCIAMCDDFISNIIVYCW
jgi:hypothetical protein